jgi:hypothetical protein
METIFTYTNYDHVLNPITMEDITGSLNKPAEDITIHEKRADKEFNVMFVTQSAQDEVDLDSLLVDTKGLIKVQ